MSNEHQSDRSNSLDANDYTQEATAQQSHQASELIHKLEIANKKIKLLKDTLMEEQNVRMDIEDELAAQIERFKELEATLQEKDNDNIRLTNDLRLLEEEYMFSTKDNNSRRAAVKGSMHHRPTIAPPIRNEQVVQLEKENKELKQKNEEIENIMIELQQLARKSEETIYEIKTNYSKHLQELEEKIKELQKTIEIKDEELKASKDEVLEQKHVNMELAKEKEGIQAELDEKIKENAKLKNETFKYKEQAEIGNQAIKKLTKEILKSEKETEVLTERLMKVQNDMLNDFATTDIFLVTKIGALLNVPAKMTFYKDKDYPHDYFLKIEDYEKCRKIRILDIESMRANDKTQNRFYLQYREGNRKPMSEQYDSNQRDKVLTYFKDFRLHAISNFESGRVTGDPTMRTYSVMH